MNASACAHPALLLVASLVACAGLGCAEHSTSVRVGNHSVLREWLEQGSLRIMTARMTDAQLAAVLADDHVPRLRSVELDRNLLTSAAVDALISSEKTQALHSLELDSNPIGDRGLERLAGWSGLATIRDLMVDGVGASATGARALAASPHIAELRALSMSANPIGDDGALALARMGQVDELFAQHAQIGGPGARALLEHAAFRRLHLDFNPIGPGAFDGIGRLSPSMAVLSLTDCGLSVADIEALASASAPSLRELGVSHNAIGDEGLRALARAAWLASLESLEVTHTGASAEGRAVLTAAWGDRPGLTLE